MPLAKMEQTQWSQGIDRWTRAVITRVPPCSAPIRAFANAAQLLSSNVRLRTRSRQACGTARLLLALGPSPHVHRTGRKHIA